MPSNVMLEVEYAIAYRTNFTQDLEVNLAIQQMPCNIYQSVKVTCNKHSHLISLILFLRLYVT